MKKFDYTVIFVVLGLVVAGLASFHAITDFKIKENDRQCIQSAIQMCELICGPNIK